MKNMYPKNKGARATAASGAGAEEVRNPADVRYGKVRADSGVHYVTDDPPPPILPGSARSTLDTKLTDANLMTESGRLLAAAAQSPYPAPAKPTLAEIQTALTTFVNAHNTAKAALDVAKTATTAKDDTRATLEVLLRDYQGAVQLLSQGDAQVITSLGLQLRKTPTRRGELPFPEGLVVNPGDVTGKLALYWLAVPGARGYNVQCAELVNGVPGAWTALKPTSRRDYVVDGLTPGKTYVFQVAAIGGKDGQSDWCPWVQRVCA